MSMSSVGGHHDWRWRVTVGHVAERWLNLTGGGRGMGCARLMAHGSWVVNRRYITGVHHPACRVTRWRQARRQSGVRTSGSRLTSDPISTVCAQVESIEHTN